MERHQELGEVVVVVARMGGVMLKWVEKGSGMGGAQSMSGWGHE